jgi:hypothetical protein
MAKIAKVSCCRHAECRADPPGAGLVGTAGRHQTAEETNPATRAGTAAADPHLVAKPCKETGGVLILSGLRILLPRPKPQPTPTPTVEGGGDAVPPARRRSDENETDLSADNTALSPLFISHAS